MPQALPFIALAAQVGAAGVSVAQGIQANRFARDEAKTAREVASIRAANERRKGRMLRAKQRVAFAKGGVDTQMGTPLDILGETAREAEMEALNRRFEGGRASDMAKFQGEQAMIGGLAQGASILGSAGFQFGQSTGPATFGKGVQKFKNYRAGRTLSRTSNQIGPLSISPDIA